MAKAGFWLRGAKGKLAGASMQKGANGQTIMREIVTPKNPKTNAQIYQRAVMSTVMKLATAGKEILDHSYQGVEVGPKCLREFIRTNVKLLRSSIATALDGAEYNPAAVCVAPKTLSFIPFEAQISRGTYDPPTSMYGGLALPVPTSGQTPAQYYEANGLVPGDIYTIVTIYRNNNADPQFEVRGYEDKTNGITQYAHVFGFLRLRVKPIPENLTVLTYGTFFEVTSEFNMVNGATLLNYELSSAPLEADKIAFLVMGSYNAVSKLIPERCSIVATSIIRSRVDEDLRSNSKLFFATDYYAADEETLDNGIFAPYILEAWRQGTEKVGDSDLILEGGNG